MNEPLQSTIDAARLREAASKRDSLRVRGVVHTPPEIARWAVARIDLALIRQLGLAGGLADARVVLLDPAVGTGVWLAAALEHTRGRAPAQDPQGSRRMLGFDVDAAALATTRALIGEEALAQGVALALAQANTLELAQPWPSSGHQVRVVLGNPPWAARSMSRGSPLSDAMLAEFRRDHRGASLNERRSGVLSDDYVRFFRWALEQARNASGGAIVCLATNASYLDGPVHRGMRGALVHAFDHIEVLDLGGNALLSKRSASASDSSNGDPNRAELAKPGRDENVFGVRVSAALTLCVRSRASGPALVSYARVSGSRRDKLTQLGDAINSTTHAPTAPWFHFVPRASAALEHGFSLADAFPFQREGVQTNRDELAIAHTRDELRTRLTAIAEGSIPLTPSRHFDVLAARRVLCTALERGDLPIAPIAYRPLDTRVVCTLAPLCHRPRPELLRAMSASELCLLSVRKDRGAAPWNMFAAARSIADSCFLSTRSSCRTRVFPTHTPEGAPNLSPEVADTVAARVGHAPGVPAFFAYALGVMGAPRFRRAHAEQLGLDYPRLPWPRDAAAFEAVGAAGEQFIAALCGDVSPPSALVFTGERRGKAAHFVAIERLVFDAEEQRLWLSEAASIGLVSAGAWTARVGQQPLIASALRPKREWLISRVLEIVERATVWALAEVAADAAHARHLSV